LRCMDSNPPLTHASLRDSGALIARLFDERTSLRNSAGQGDAREGFPVKALETLRRMGVLAAPLPTSEEGRGWGTEDAGQPSLCAALEIIGYGSLALGRIFEAHVNAISLIFRYGGSEVRTLAASEVRRGRFLALWVAPADEPVRAVRSGSSVRIAGTKPFCTAAGFAAHAVITVQDEQNDEQMILVDASQVKVHAGSSMLLHGMGDTSTKAVMIDCVVPAGRFVGGPGDYLREPDFSTGAWRTSAVTTGGLQALVDETIRQLRTRDRHTNPHQAARIGQMLIKLQSARMWVRSAAERTVAPGFECRERTAFVNLARLAVEQACLEIIPLVQRSLGLRSFVVGNPVEQFMRDIATYLRQPAGDEALTEAALTFAEAAIPSALGDKP